MSGNLILARPAKLSESGSLIGKQVTHVDSLASNIQSATNTASGSLSGVSTLSAAGAELEQLQQGITTIMGCLSSSLLNLGAGLQNASQAFATTDSNLANMFSSLDQSLQPYIGYEAPPPPVIPALPQKPPAKKKSGGGWWHTALNITAGTGLILAAGLAVVAGGGPEDPVGDAVAGEAGDAAINEFADAFK